MKKQVESKFIKKSRTGEVFDLKKIFANVSIFEGIADHEGIAKLAEQSTLVEVPERKYIAREGETSERSFIVLSGKIEISRKSFSGEDDIILDIITVTEKKIEAVDNERRELKNLSYPFIGEQAIISHGTRGATIRSLTKTFLLEIHSAVFLKIADEHPRVGMHVYQEICKLLQTRLMTANKNVAALFEVYLDRLHAEDLMDEEE